MKSFILFAVFALFCVLAEAQKHNTIVPFVGANAVEIREGVIATQKEYNGHFDDSIIVCGFNNTSQDCIARRALVQEVFCTDGSFRGWTAISPVVGNPTPLVTFAPTLQATAGLYAFYANGAGGVFANFSRHDITGQVVVLYRNPFDNNNLYANFTANIRQDAYSAGTPGSPNPNFSMAVNFGSYHNTYKITLNLAGDPLDPNYSPYSYCMTNFVATTIINVPSNIPYPPAINWSALYDPTMSL